MTRQLLDSERKRRLVFQVVGIILILLITLLRPRIERWWHGANAPPDSVQNQQPNFAPASVPTLEISEPANSSGGLTAESDLNGSDLNNTDIARSDASRSEATVTKQSSATKSSEGSPAEVDERTKPDVFKDSGRSTTASQQSSSTPKPKSATTGDSAKKTAPPSKTDSPPRLGELVEIRPRVFRSTAGLIYRSGSADGHRLDHVLEHGEDNSSKPTHGVFDGDRAKILATIDEAWNLAQKGDRDVRTETQNGRDIHTVRFNRRIGYVGGQSGQRQNHPECRYLRLVLEDDNVVITAYPTRSF